MLLTARHIESRIAGALTIALSFATSGWAAGKAAPLIIPPGGFSETWLAKLGYVFVGEEGLSDSYANVVYGNGSEFISRGRIPDLPTGQFGACSIHPSNPLADKPN